MQVVCNDVQVVCNHLTHDSLCEEKLENESCYQNDFKKDLLQMSLYFEVILVACLIRDSFAAHLQFIRSVLATMRQVRCQRSLQSVCCSVLQCVHDLFYFF